MSTRNNAPILLLATGLLLTAALSAGARAPHRHKPATTKPTPMQTATIENSGSTNTKGYRIVVSSNGKATVEGQAVTALTKIQTTAFFHDLQAAMPLSSLPAGRGMRSVSFGTSTVVTYRGQTSPDLTFAGDPRAAALKADITAITEALHVRNLPRHPVTPQPHQP